MVTAIIVDYTIKPVWATTWIHYNLL